MWKMFLGKPKQMIFTAVEEEIYNSSTSCHICGGQLGEDKVRDHCHLTSKFGGAAHNECNLRYRVPRFIPVFFLSRYDAHLFIKKLPYINNSEGNIKCIAKNEENYISFSKELFVDEYSNKNVKLNL